MSGSILAIKFDKNKSSGFKNELKNRILNVLEGILETADHMLDSKQLQQFLFYDEVKNQALLLKLMLINLFLDYITK